MEKLKQDFHQVTLDQIASYTRLSPDETFQNVAFTLAAKLGLLIGKEAIEVPLRPLVIGTQEKKKLALERKRNHKTRN
jgi:hypothetical protein